MPANNCGNDLSGTKCTGDHSKLVCGSGNVYCATLGVTDTSGSDENNPVDESEATIFYMQAIPVYDASAPAKTCFG